MKRLMPKALALAALAGLASATWTDAQAENLPRPNLNLQLDEYQIDMRDYVFPSGLRIIFQEDHSQPLVSITSVIDRGSSADPIGQEGIAHLVEHLWFRSLHGDLPKVWEVLAEFGANLNASTATDWTNYMTVAPKDALVPLLRLEALRITDPVRGVTEQDVNTEREIVRNELRMRYENTALSALWYLTPKLYPLEHEYGRVGIGTHDSINNVTLKNVQDFTANNYTPENTTIVIVGDFDVETTDPETGETVNNAWEYIKSAFPMEILVDPENPDAPFEMQDPPQRVTPDFEEPPPPNDTEITYHKGGVEKPTMWIGWSLPGGYRPHDPLMSMVGNTWLTFAASTYLLEDFDITKDDIEDINAVQCFTWQSEVSSQAMCYVEMDSAEDAEETLEKALDGLYNMWNINNRPMMDYMFSQGSAAFQAGIFNTVDMVSSVGAGRATETADYVHFTGDPQYYSRQFEHLGAVDASAGAEFARTYLNRDRAVAVVIEPYDDGDVSLDSSDAIYKGAVRQEETASMIDLSEVDATMLEGVMSPPNLTEVREFDLDNGLHVVMMPYGTAPLVQVRLLFKGGEWWEPLDGISEYTYEWLYSDYTGDPLRIAGSWQQSQGSTHQTFGVAGSSANLEAALYFTREQLEDLTVNVDDRITYVKAAKKSIRYERTFPDWWAGLLADQRLYPDHRQSMRRDEVYYENLKYPTAQMKQWKDTMYRPEHATLFVVGRMDDPDTAEEAVRTYFSGWEVKSEPMAYAELPDVPDPTPGRKVYVLNKDKQSQTQALMVCQIGPATMENGEARQMLAAVIDEMAWDALREQSGVTYGAGSGQSGNLDGSARMGISSLVQNDAAGLAVSTFFDISDKVAAGEVDEDLLTLQKLSAARKYVLGHQTNGQMLGRLMEPFYMGYGWEMIEGHAERLAAVTPADLTGQMERCHGNEVVTLIGPRDVITPQLDEAGIEYEVYDWEAEYDRMFRENDPKAYEKKKKKEAKDAKKKAKKGEGEEDES